MAKGIKRFRPDQRPKQDRAAAVKRGLTAAEEAAAAAYESALDAPREVKSVARPIDPVSRSAAAQRLATEIAAEMPVVRRDLGRIVVTYGALIGLLAAIWLVTTLTGFIAT